jgi:hypothetical protein
MGKVMAKGVKLFCVGSLPILKSNSFKGGGMDMELK